jgi:hypothetical protein
MPITSVTLSERHGPGERSPSRRSVLEQSFQLWSVRGAQIGPFGVHRVARNSLIYMSLGRRGIRGWSRSGRRAGLRLCQFRHEAAELA